MLTARGVHVRVVGYPQAKVPAFLQVSVIDRHSLELYVSDVSLSI